MFCTVNFSNSYYRICGRPQRTQRYVNKIRNMQITFREFETPVNGGLRTLLATRTDAVSAVRYFWPQAISHYYT